MRVIRSVSSVENRFPPTVLPRWQTDKADALISGFNCLAGQHLANAPRIAFPGLQVVPDLFLDVVIVSQGECLEHVESQFACAVFGDQYGTHPRQCQAAIARKQRSVERNTAVFGLAS